MNISPKYLENKEKTKSPAKENNLECKELKIVNKDNEIVAPKTKITIGSKKKVFITITIIPREVIPSARNNNTANKIRFIISSTIHKEKKEKEDNKNSPFLNIKIEDSKLNIFKII